MEMVKYKSKLSAADIVSYTWHQMKKKNRKYMAYFLITIFMHYRIQ